MRLVQLCRWISLTYPRGVVTVHLIIMVIAASYALRIKFDPNIAERFGPHHPLAVSIRYFNEHFVGTNTVEIFVKGDADNLLSPRTLAYFASIHDRLTRIPEVKSVSSVNDLFALSIGPLTTRPTTACPILRPPPPPVCGWSSCCNPRRYGRSSLPRNNLRGSPPTLR